MTNPHQFKNKKFIRMPEVKSRVGLCESSIYDKVAEGSFPSPIKISSRASAWVEEEVDAWIEERINSSRSSVAA